MTAQSSNEGEELEADRHAADRDDRVLQEAVAFSELLAESSLGTDDARSDRLVGCKEINELYGGLGEAHDAYGAAQREFDLSVADQLDVRGYTFEAELKYRRVAGSANPSAAAKLAIMLEAKGYRRHAWPFYAQAAHAKDTNSLLRLAVISRQRGEYKWATALVRCAADSMRKDVLKSLLSGLDRLAGQTQPASSAGLLAAGSSAEQIQATFALGSMLFALTGRADLARLAYCSGISRGHSLSAVSLLDLAPRQPDEAHTSGTLKCVLRSALDESAYERYVEARPRRDPLSRHAAGFRDGLDDASLDTLCSSLHSASAESRGQHQASVQRVLNTTRVMTVLRGFSVLGCDSNTMPAITAAADKTCSEISRAVEVGKTRTGISLTDVIWTVGQAELDGAVSRTGRKNRRLGGGERKRQKTGITARMGAALQALPGEQKKVITMRLAGLQLEDTAKAVRYSPKSTAQIYRRATKRLQEEQQGEQFTPELKLWREVDNCFEQSLDDSLYDARVAARQAR